MAAKLALQNPSEYPRGGFVSTPWKPLQDAGIGRDDLVLRYRQGTPLRAQIDDVEPGDSNRAVLVFELDGDVGPGPDDYSQSSGYVTLGQGPRPPVEGGPSLEVAAEGFKLINERLDIWFNSAPGDAHGRGWRAGSASSVQLDRVEILDNFQALGGWQGHDDEKRLQIDRIRLGRAPWDEEEYQDEILIDKPYEVISRSAGPVRASVTLASQPFPYPYREPGSSRAQSLRCRFYRTISLYRGADYLVEDLYLKGEPLNAAPGATTAVPLAFKARYFLYMDLGLLPNIAQFAHIPDWLSLGCDFLPWQGYGFATDVHAGSVTNPHPGFLGPPDRADRSFSWEIGSSKAAKCVHLFRRCRPRDLADAAGRAWYLQVLKPLRAALVNEETR